MESFIKEILITEEEIAARVALLGAEISRDYQGKEVIVISVLKGAMVFTADLIRKIEASVILEGMIVSSYGSGTKSSGQVKIIQDVKSDLADKHVLVVDDIVDTGNTLYLLMELLAERKPKTLKSCTFLDKPSRRMVDFSPEYVGYEIPDEFVIGYGLDYNEKYRALPYVAVIKSEAIL